MAGKGTSQEQVRKDFNVEAGAPAIVWNQYPNCSKTTNVYIFNHPGILIPNDFENGHATGANFPAASQGFNGFQQRYPNAYNYFPTAQPNVSTGARIQGQFAFPTTPGGPSNYYTASWQPKTSTPIPLPPP